MALNVKVETDELRLLLESGYLLIQRNELQKAKEVFEGVEALGQGLDVAGLALSHLHLIHGNVKDAEKALRGAVKANPKFALAYANLGELCHTQGRKDEAQEFLGKAEELDPQGPAGQFARTLKAAIAEGGADYHYMVHASADASPKKGKS